MPTVHLHVAQVCLQRPHGAIKLLVDPYDCSMMVLTVNRTGLDILQLQARADDYKVILLGIMVMLRLFHALSQSKAASPKAGLLLSTRCLLTDLIKEQKWQAHLGSGEQAL